MAENIWVLNDSAPVSIAQAFAQAPEAWPVHDWLACLGMQMLADAGGSGASGSNRMMMGLGA